VNEPLALLLCERGLVATQLAQRLEGLRYRMLVVAKPAELGPRAEAEKPMVILADVDGFPEAALTALTTLRSNPATAHIPVISFAREVDDATQAALVARGATVVVTETAILGHLGQLLDRALDVH
jgi:CheY-like chemotaxis protein